MTIGATCAPANCWIRGPTPPSTRSTIRPTHPTAATRDCCARWRPTDLANGGPRAWEKVSREYGQRCIDVWKEAAPNLGDNTFLDWATYSPLDIARRMPNMVQADWIGGLIDLGNMLDHRPGPILSEYRTPIGNLYMCGATQHPARVRDLRAGIQRTRNYRARSARRTLVEMTAIADIPVRLADGSTSGLASIVQQFLEQQLADSASRRRRAGRLRGRLGLTATDYRASVTVDFRGRPNRGVRR